MSPDMFSRAEDVRSRQGLAEAKNVRTTTTGGFESRTGFRFCVAAKDSTRRGIVRSFAVSSTESVVIIGNGWDGNPSNYGTFRFLVNGQPLLYTPGAFPLYRESSTVTTALSGFDVLINWTLQPFTADGDPVTFSTTNELGWGLVPGVTYYVRDRLTNSFKLSATPLGPVLQVTGSALPAGVQTGHAVYQAGDIVQNSTNYFYCRAPSLGIEPGVDPGWQTYWYQLPVTRELEVPHQYLDADLVSLDMRSQSANVLTICHRNYRPHELVRRSAILWAYRPIAFAATVPPPAWSSPAIVPSAGQVSNITAATNPGSPGRLQLSFATDISNTYRIGDTFYLQGLNPAANVADGFYSVAAAGTTTVDVRTVTGEAYVVPAGGPYGAGGTIRLATPTATTSNFYRITSLDADGRESDGGPASGAFNILTTPGSYNTLNWIAVPGASLYRIYRSENGRYVLIGETSATTFKDADEAPDDSFTLPIGDTTLGGTALDYPAAAGNFEGRQLFGGTLNRPQTVWGTRSGTSNDLSYHIPLQPDDRLNVTLKSGKPVTIRHLVPISQTLVVLTSTEEFRIASPDGVALTADVPTPARSITSVGASERWPVVVGSSLVFESERRGQIRELGFRSDTGWIVGNVSSRCSDWFDGYQMADGIAQQQSPIPTLWAVRNDGTLLGFTYVPEEQVGGWHQHTTDGTFESVCVAQEGTEDIVYVVVRRTIGGTQLRYIERMAERRFDTLADRRFVDSHLTYDGRNTTATTLTITGGTTYAAGQTVTLTASAATFAFPATTDVGDRIKWLGLYRVRITATSSTTVATGVIEDSFPGVPAGPSAVWTWGRDTFAGLSHLEGKTVQVVADGVVLAPQTVTGGAITLRNLKGATTVGYKVHVGLAYTAEAVTMPPAIPVDGLGHGRVGSPSHAVLRLRRSAPFRFGQLGADDAAYNTTSQVDDFTGQSRELSFGSFTEDKQIRMVQTEPLPMAVTGAVVTIAWGD
jgi:hypothetical protein